MMEANSPLNAWLKTPSSSRDLVTVDPKLFIKPPTKFKYGYVPIVVVSHSSFAQRRLDPSQRITAELERILTTYFE